MITFERVKEMYRESGLFDVYEINGHTFRYDLRTYKDHPPWGTANDDEKSMMYYMKKVYQFITYTYSQYDGEGIRLHWNEKFDKEINEDNLYEYFEELRKTMNEYYKLLKKEKIDKSLNSIEKDFE